MVVRVFLLDDHEIVREGLRALVDSTDEFRVVGEAATCADAIARIPATRPDVIVIDARLPDGNGIDVCRTAREKVPGARCLVLSAFADGDIVAAAHDADVKGFILKQLHRDQIVDAIRRVHAGERVFGHGVDVCADPPATGRADDATRLLDTLTPTEHRVLELVAEGLTNRQIGRELNVAEKTAKNHVSSILTKLGVTRRTEAAVYLARATA